MNADFAPPSDRTLAGARLAGRVAVVSGAGSGAEPGVGAAIALLFAQQGARVGVLDVSPARAAHTVEIIRASGGQALTLPADVRDAEACAAALKQMHDAFGPVSALVNSAALARPGDVISVTEADWRDTLDIVLTGALNLTRAAAADLRTTRGAIVNMSSIAATQSFGAIAYSAAKAGLEAMTRDMAFSLGPAGVRVNAIALGPLSTPMVEEIPEPARSARRERAMLAAEGDAWDAAFAALFLASDEARWITAHTLRVDAGVSVAGKPRARMEEK